MQKKVNNPNTTPIKVDTVSIKSEHPSTTSMTCKTAYPVRQQNLCSYQTDR